MLGRGEARLRRDSKEAPAGPVQAAVKDEAVSDDKTARWKDYRERPQAGRLGIACSGGGIRSASYNLGALQQLRKAGLLKSPKEGGAEYLAAISGGSYMAVAHTITASQSAESVFTDDLPPWAPGSPEERRLRNRSDYLAPGAVGKLWFIANLLYSLAWNLVPLGLLVWISATLLGWAYAAGLQPGIATAAPPAGGPARVALVAGPLVGAVAAIALRRVLDHFPSLSDAFVDAVMDGLRRWTVRLILLGAVLGAVVFALPALVHEAVPPLERLADLAGSRVGIGELLVSGQLAALATVLLAVYRAGRGLGRRLLPVMARVLGPLLVLVPLLYWAKQAAEAGFSWGALVWPFAAATAVVVVMGLIAHNVRWSIHPLYREQLSTVFAVRRTEGAGGLVAEALPYSEPVLFSLIGNEHNMPGRDSSARMPKLVVCAALNVSDRSVPPGRASETFTFTAESSGSPLTDYVPTTFFENGRGAAAITLPAMMAISGAAVSPSMGKMSRPSVRFLLALFNVRLGVWVPNPLFREAHMRRRNATGLRARIVRGWKEPGLLYVIYEALGMNSLSREFLYITDGGHWENLGLVELLRRGCTEIICIDAAGDELDTFHTLGEAIALARAELRVDIQVDLRGLRPDPETGTSPTDNVLGTFRYPDGTEGTLVFVKAAMPADAPWDLHAYRRRDPRFPCHSTGDQFFDDSQFESYRALGAHAGKGAAATLLAIRS